MARIVRSAVDDDPVRLHGAIVATLELDGRTLAKRQVFAIAIGIGEQCHPACGRVVASAIDKDLSQRPPAI